jgi:hypothetical protein
MQWHNILDDKNGGNKWGNDTTINQYKQRSLAFPKVQASKRDLWREERPTSSPHRIQFSHGQGGNFEQIKCKGYRGPRICVSDSATSFVYNFFSMYVWLQIQSSHSIHAVY